MKAFAIILLSFFWIKEKTASPFSPGERFQTGYVSIDSTSNDNIFYWLFDSRNDPANDPLVIWLQGGPGGSSDLGAIKEIGPFRIDDNASEPRILKESWNNKANIMFVDQPANTGFSTGKIEDYCTTDDCIAKDFYIFFIGFLNQHPEFKNRPLIIAGESYAGHMIPAISAYFKAQSIRKPHLGINLVSAAIGNGLTVPKDQYPGYAEYALKQNFIDEEEYKQMNVKLQTCLDLLAKNSTDTYNTCWDYVFYAENVFKAKHGYVFNVYDYHKKCEGELCYNFTNVATFFNREDTKKALNIKYDKEWKDCNDDILTTMIPAWTNDLTPQIQYLLINNINILIYVGDLDYQCNYIGNKAWTLALDWGYKTEFNNAGDQPWPVEDGRLSLPKGYGSIEYKRGDYGLLRKYKNFAFLQVFEAGHMAPMDQPAATLVMLEQLVKLNIEQPKKNLRQQ